MKLIKFFTLVTVFSLLSMNAFGGKWFREWRQKRQQRQVQHQTAPAPGKPTGVPLDGGLLALLGAAGVAYYGVRKQKKTKSIEE